MVKKLRKPIAFLLSFAMIMTVLLDFPSNTFGIITAGIRASAATVTPAQPDAGDGTKESPYEIDSAAELYWFAALVNGTLTDGTVRNTAACAKLTADIKVNSGVLKADGTLADDTSAFENWTPIGNSSYWFTGTFDGQGHTISGLYLSVSSADYVGLFGYIGTAGKVKNVGLEASYFCGKNYVGGVCGHNFGTITNCYSTGAVSGTGYVGGVCSYNDGTITYCYNTGAASSSKSDSVGGVCGGDYGTTADCYYNTDTCTAFAFGYSGTATNVLGKTTEQFSSGEVAYLLNGDQSEIIWGQKLGTDASPVLGGAQVYATTGCITYSNDSANVGAKEHKFSYGICTDCAKHEPAKVDEDGIYQISSVTDLYWLAEEVNSGNTDIDAVLTADITVNTGVLRADGTLAEDTSGFKKWTPIGNYDNRFIGTFDGNGHTISGLYFDDARVFYIGLFGAVGTNGIISDVGVEASYLNGNAAVGGVCGLNSGGTITDCCNTGTVSGITSVGGVCGNSTDYASIKRCYNTGKVIGTSVVGGVCGNNSYSTISDCFNTGDVNALGFDIGGVCGSNFFGKITSCYNTGKVSGYLYDVGGVIGDNNNGSKITDCYYNSDVFEGMAASVNNGTVTNVLGKTTKQFASGEVAYLLNGDQSEIVWKQNIGEDASPVLTGGTVYRNEGYAGCEHKPGEMKYVYSNSTENFPIYPDAEEVIDPSVVPTCTETGLTEGSHCSVCNTIIKQQEVIPENGHSYSTEWTVDIEPTCTEDGSKSHHCTVCSDKKDVTVIDADGHSYGNWIIDKSATCTENGSQHRTCSDCEDVITIQITATGHIYSGKWTVDTEPTCTEQGSKSHHCTVCGVKTDITAIDATGHSYVSTVVNPTNTAQGYTLHTCSVCGDSYKDSYTDKLITVAPISSLTLGGRAANALRLNWTKNTSADGYIIEMYKDGKWIRVTKITNIATTTYRVTGLAAGTAYKFRVRAYKMNGKTALYSSYTSTFNATTTYRITGLKAGTAYKFRVKAYKMSGKKALYSGYTATLAARTNPSKVTGLTLGGRAADALRLNWTKNTSADGYIIEMYKGGKWVRVAKVTKNATTTYRISGLAKGTTYKFRVKAYKMSGKTALYSGYTNISGKTTG